MTQAESPEESLFPAGNPKQSQQEVGDKQESGHTVTFDMLADVQSLHP